MATQHFQLSQDESQNFSPEVLLGNSSLGPFRTLIKMLKQSLWTIYFQNEVDKPCLVYRLMKISIFQEKSLKLIALRKFSESCLISMSFDISIFRVGQGSSCADSFWEDFNWNSKVIKSAFVEQQNYISLLIRQNYLTRVSQFIDFHETL